ncbi:MAG: energy transducer TonB [Bacteroidetes bacterium]|nr:energy transducer TonB [Bacteroidota bacterium]
MSVPRILQLPLFSILLFGCSMFGGLSSNAVPPVLIQKTPFPPLPSNISSRTFDLRTDLIVSRTGSVVRAELMNSSGDPEWDSMAVNSIMTWKYSPATLNGNPIQMRISQVAHIVHTPPLTMILSQIICRTPAEADSAYNALQNGMSFDSLISEIPPSGSVINSGYLGEIDIRQFSEDIQQELQKLRVNMYTQPLHLGMYYAIFMRHQSLRIEPLPR